MQSLLKIPFVDVAATVLAALILVTLSASPCLAQPYGMSFSIYTDTTLPDPTTIRMYSSVSDNSWGCSHYNYLNTRRLQSPSGRWNQIQSSNMYGYVSLLLEGETGIYQSITSGQYYCSCFQNYGGYGTSQPKCLSNVWADSDFLPVGKSVQLHASGCSGYQWSMASGPGSVNSSSGMYTASDQSGQAVVQVTCPNCISSTLQLTAFKLLLDKPEIAYNYKFDATTNGQLTVEFKARVDPDDPDVRDHLNGKVNFGMDPIGESQAHWTDPGSGAAVYSDGAYGASVTFTNLPSSNSDFGPKGAWLTVNGWGRIVERTGDNRPKIFYSAYATNHPGDGTQPNYCDGSRPRTPNYFYYYMQTTAAYGSSTGYCAAGSTISTDLPFNYWVEAASEAFGKRIPNPGANQDEILTFIDLFAWACRHETKHNTSWTGWWIVPGSYNLSVHDKDVGTWGDKLPDPLEPSIPAYQGGPYDPRTLDTYPNDPYSWGLPDSERYCCMSAPVWNTGSADTQDWAYPGKNWH